MPTLLRSILSTSTLLCLTAWALLSATDTAQSTPAGDALGRCLADNTTGRGRKDLARWVFVSMAAHPEIRPLAALQAGGSAFETAFSTLGEPAMMELMNDADVNATLTAFERYLDQGELAQLEE